VASLLLSLATVAVVWSTFRETGVAAGAVRVNIGSNPYPYLYEIANPRPSSDPVSDVLSNSESQATASRSRAATRSVTPIHPVRGFSAPITAPEAGSAPVAAAANNRRSVAASVPSAPVRSAALRQAPGGRSNQPTEDREEENEADIQKPYKIAYDSVDGNGTTMRREESKDDKGVVRGSYSYTDPFGIFRVVEYIADENGFRASIRTNEPGIAKTENGDPSGVIYEVDPPPPPRAAARSASAS